MHIGVHVNMLELQLLCFQSNSHTVPEKAVENDPNTWAPETYVGDLHGVPGSWLGPGQAPAAWPLAQ